MLTSSQEPRTREEMKARKRAADHRIAAAARRFELSRAAAEAVAAETTAPAPSVSFNPPSRLTITELLAMIDEQREEIRRLEEALSPTVILPVSWRLTALERDVLLPLMRGVQMTREQLLTVVYGTRCDDPPQAKTMDVVVCKIRQKLACHCPGVTIKTVWGQGYVIEPASLAALRAGIERAAADLDHATAADIGDAA